MIVFDLDDTLYPESQYAKSGYEAVGKWLAENKDVQDFAPRAWHVFEHGDRSRIFNIVFDELNIPLDKQLLMQLVETYRSHMPVINPFDDALSTLDEVGKVSELGLLTDGFLVAQRNKVEALGISGRFAHIVFTDELGENREHWKPSPQGYLPFQALWEDTHSTTAPVYIGDNPTKDFVTARKLGWHTIRIRRPNTLHEKLEPETGFEADVDLKSLDQVRSYLERSGLVG